MISIRDIVWLAIVIISVCSTYLIQPKYKSLTLGECIAVRDKILIVREIGLNSIMVEDWARTKFVISFKHVPEFDKVDCFNFFNEDKQ